MEIKIVDNVANLECDLLVVAMFEGEKTSQELINNYAIDVDKFEGKLYDSYLLQTYGKQPARKLLALGLGKREEFNQDKLRLAIAKSVKKAMSIKSKSVGFLLENIGFDYSRQFAYGALIADYDFDKYKSEKKNNKIETVFVSANESEIRKGEKIVSAVNFARNLINEPAQFATPNELANLACDLGLETKIYNKDECEKMGMGAFLAVGQGSAIEPKFIHMKYTCENPKKRLAIIGKGITFDSGGLDLKPAASMLTMKDDMSGSACVLGVMSVIKEFNPEIEVHGLIATCENMPSGSSYKPGDILTAKNGKTIEIDNTDAEGRLTLADAICYASELQVDEIIDIATLTGACMVALGTQATGIMGNNQELIDNIIEVAKDNGEVMWQLPMFDGYKDSLKSDIADMKNTGSRYGGASTAGKFLENFVGKDIKWAHLDIAGTAYLEKPQGEFISGGTGAGVRTLINYILR